MFECEVLIERMLSEMLKPFKRVVTQKKQKQRTLYTFFGIHSVAESHIVGYG